jgi:hypothetical protein
VLRSIAGNSSVYHIEINDERKCVIYIVYDQHMLVYLNDNYFIFICDYLFDLTFLYALCRDDLRVDLNAARHNQKNCK